MLNAANEVAVAAFLDGAHPLHRIAAACAETLGRLPSRRSRALDDALAADVEARAVARDALKLPARIAARRLMDAASMRKPRTLTL